MSDIQPPAASSWAQTQVKQFIENTIAAVRAKSRSDGWSKADNVLASYTLWEARLSSHGWMIKCVASEPTSADFSPHVKKKEIKRRLEADTCPATYVVERRDKGNATTPKVSYAFHFQL